MGKYSFGVNGKGSKPKVPSISQEEYGNRFDSIDWGRKPKESEKVTTPDNDKQTKTDTKQG